MQGIHAVPAEFVEAQMKSVLLDIGADVVRVVLNFVFEGSGISSNLNKCMVSECAGEDRHVAVS